MSKTGDRRKMFITEPSCFRSCSAPSHSFHKLLLQGEISLKGQCREFFALGFFHESSSHVFENSRKYSQFKVYQRHRGAP
jgi:hypothetical protein